MKRRLAKKFTLRVVTAAEMKRYKIVKKKLPRPVNPNIKARRLFLSLLSVKHRNHFRKYGRISFKSQHGRTYRIERSGYVSGGGYTYWCVHTHSIYGLPPYDRLSAIYLAIRHRENYFRMIANPRG